MSTSPGVVLVDLGVVKAELRCTRLALRKLSMMYPSQYDLSMRCAQFNLVAIADVIQVAAGGEDHERDDLEEAIFNVGVVPVSAQVVKYLRMLWNGGREPDPNVTPKGDGEKNGV